MGKKRKPPAVEATGDLLALEYIPLSRAVLWDDNPKEHDIDALIASINAHGFKDPPAFDRALGSFVEGHGRTHALTAMRERGDTPPRGVGTHPKHGWCIPVLFGVDAASQEAAAAYAVAHNQLTIVGGWDERQLLKVVKQVEAKLGDQAAAATGISDKLLKEIAGRVRAGEDAPPDPGAQVDRASELQEIWQVQRGDVWEIESKSVPGRVHRLMCGDSTSEEGVGALMGEECISLVVTDPPYGVEYADKNKFLNAISRGSRIQSPIEGDHGSKGDIQEMWRATFEQMNTVMLPGAVVYCFMPQGGNQMMMMMMMMMMGAGIEPRHELIWLKNNHVLGRVDYAYKHEPILYAWKDGGHKFYGGFQTSVIECPRPQKSDLHPTTKPVELIVKLIGNSSLVTERIYDPFLGSGTTAVAAEQTGRLCYGMEIEPKYCAVALQRLTDMGLEARRV